MDTFFRLQFACVFGLFFVIAFGVGRPAGAHTSESFHDCCSNTLEHRTDARQTNLPACNVAHRVTDTSCDALCCIGHALIGDPCPGIIGCPGGECPLEFDLPDSQCADSDGDGLLDSWETAGLDVDGDGSIDIDLPAMGADPMHKDLFVELDYMPDAGWSLFGSNRPTQAVITEWKRAFCAAPPNTGGVLNPDGRPGVNLWVDTGGLMAVYPDGMETPIGPCSCGDSADNDDDGMADNADPDCLAFAPDLGEDGAGPWTCDDDTDNGGGDGADRLDPDCLVYDFARTETDIAHGSCLDGVDNDNDGLFDTSDPDCKVGDDFGGGNEIEATDISGLTTLFYAIKATNFSSERAMVFRYGLSARPARNNDGTSTGSNSATTLNDTTQAWLIDEWLERPVEITDGRGAGQKRTITGNTATQLTVDTSWSTTPDETSEYEISRVGGRGELGGNDFIEFNHSAETLMHELGHTLNLAHGGDVEDNCKPNYVSIMNYDHRPGIFQVGGVGGQDLDGDGVEDGVIIDYSPPRYATPAGLTRTAAPYPSLIEDTLNENLVMAANDRANRMIFVNASGDKVQAQVNGDFDNDGPGDGNGNGLGDGVDWDDSGDTSGAGLTVNVDTVGGSGTPSACDNSTIRTAADPLTGYNDWFNLSLGFGHFGDAADAAVDPVMTPEPTRAEIALIEAQRNITDLSITQTSDPTPVEVGENLDYTLTVRNLGPNPAAAVRVVDTLPANAAYVSDTGGCAAGPPGTLTCDSRELHLQSERQIAVTVDTSGVCVGGLPTAMVSTVQTANLAQSPEPDPNPADNTTSLTVTPVDTTPPDIQNLTVSSDTLSPPSNHKFVPVTVSATVTDICDAAPICRIVSVNSNEPINNRGDGHTMPDWEITGDVTANLRAERAGGGDGRIYTVTFQCTDASNNSASETVEVTVLHSNRR